MSARNRRLQLQADSFGRAANTMYHFTGIAAQYKLLSLRASWNDWEPTTPEYTEALSSLHTRSAQVRHRQADARSFLPSPTSLKLTSSLCVLFCSRDSHTPLCPVPVASHCAPETAQDL